MNNEESRAATDPAKPNGQTTDSPPRDPVRPFPRGQSLARVLAAVINAQEQEGARVARLLHDEVGQTMSAAGLHLDVLRMDVEQEAPEVAARIIECQKILEQAVDQVRSLSYEMNPQVVERAGLGAALDRLAGRYRDITTQRVRLQVDSSVRLPGKLASALYKVAECALDNAVKHSGGKRVEVFVRQQPAGVELEVRDDGDGFDVNDALENPVGLGLLLMGCYAEQAGLKLRIESSAEEGTIIRALFPEARRES